MNIIDNKKDYYDYLMGVYGKDEKITFDRRGSVTFDYIQKNFPQYCKLTMIEVRIGNKEYQFKRDYNYKTCEFTSDWYMPEKIIVGYRWRNDYTEYPNPIILSEANLKSKYTSSRCMVFSENRFQNNNNVDLTDCPIVISIHSCSNDRLYGGYAYKCFIPNPILSTFPIKGFIPAEDVWNEVYNFISARIDKPFVDTRTDVQHLESAGFDKKISFRNVK